MTTKEINALEVRYKATALMLLELDLLNGDIDTLMEQGHMAFDCGNYPICTKILDLVNAEILNILE
jgi:hypothetical protein